jgi:hypothetical protein
LLPPCVVQVISWVPVAVELPGSSSDLPPVLRAWIPSSEPGAAGQAMSGAA